MGARGSSNNSEVENIENAGTKSTSNAQLKKTSGHLKVVHERKRV